MFVCSDSPDAPRTHRAVYIASVVNAYGTRWGLAFVFVVRIRAYRPPQASTNGDRYTTQYINTAVVLATDSFLYRYDYWMAGVYTKQDL